MNKYILLVLLLFSQLCYACTGFGIITDTGTLIGRNRDYYYNPQKFERMYPIQQFHNWYENNYGHNNQFYALISKNNVSMGVNQNGLSIIEEDSPIPPDAKENRKFQQPENGTAEGMIKYGIFQNFNTVDEIIPFLSKIFSMAEPHFYQIADAKQILTVEVSYGKNNTDPKRRFNYKVISKPGDYFVHTNYYLSSSYSEFNSLRSDTDFFNGAKNRLQKMTDLILNSKIINVDIAATWLMNTSSDVSSKKDKNWCLNTSLFRSYLKGLKSIDINSDNDKIFGTVSSMIVNNKGDLKKSPFYLIMVDSITAGSDNNQIIKYKELRTSIAKLFDQPEPVFIDRQFSRKLPMNGICD